jgi:hypothetical protein
VASYHEFSDTAVQHAIDALAAHGKVSASLGAQAGSTHHLVSGEFSALAECISVTVNNNQICLNLPLGIGSVCLPIPISIPNGTAAQACLSICTTFGIPTGVSVTVSVAGQVIISKSFGKC